MNRFCFVLALAGSSFGAFGDNMTCRLIGNESVKISGKVTSSEATIRIDDPTSVLEIKDLNSELEIELPRLKRKREDQFAFARYYADFNAWQDIQLSVPKSLKKKTFVAFLTVYFDDGDRMVPADSQKFICDKIEP